MSDDDDDNDGGGGVDDDVHRMKTMTMVVCLTWFAGGSAQNC